MGAVAGLVMLRRELEEAAALAESSSPASGEVVPGLPPCESMASVEPRAAGARYVNPVCGMAVDIASARHVVDWGGQRVYFCCDGCKLEFERAPEKYLATRRSAYPLNRQSRPNRWRKHERSMERGAAPHLLFSAVVLAAGMSSRMQGQHKLLLPVDGEPAVRRTVSALAEAGRQKSWS